LSLFNELKRRNVFKVGIAYVIVAWLVAQVLQLVFESFGTPDWAIKTVLVLLATGLPFSLFLAWAFEMTPEGLKREHEVDRSQSITSQTGKKLNTTIFAVMAMALAYFVYDKFVLSTGRETAAIESAVEEATSQNFTEQADTTEATSATDNSIAVLPFVNMSDDASNEYFSDGLSEELLNLLTKIPELRVTSRSSAFSYKDKNFKITDVGRELNVSNILEGSVRKSGDQVRITAQLIKVDGDVHLWSESYTRELTDIFELQDEIATAVVKALRIELLDEEMSPDRVTISPAAYDLFLRGRGERNENIAGSLERAADYLQRAIEIEPEYAAAMALLAGTYLDMDEFGSMSITESLRLSGPLVDRALELESQLPDAWVALGYRQWRLDQNRQAGESFQRALELAPSNIRALIRYSNVLDAEGHFRKYLELYRTLSELDPQNPNHEVTYEYVRAYFGENELVAESLDRLRKQHYDDPRFYDGSATYYRSTHQYDRMISAMVRVQALRPADAWAPGNVSSALFLLGANDAGEQWLERTRQVNPHSRYLVRATYNQFRVNKKYGTLTAFMRDTWMKEATEANYSYLGSALMLEGKPAESYEVLKESLQKHPYEPETGNISLSLDGALWLILAARAVGDEALANELLDKVGIQVRNTVEKRYYVLSNQALSAAYYAIAGERIRALFTLQQAAENGFAVPSDLETPFFDEMKDKSDFQAILQQVRNNQAMMRDKVLALDNLSPKQDSVSTLTDK
jgi:TolB-like protein/Tfp pilus assembly protein PilF